MALQVRSLVETSLTDRTPVYRFVQMQDFVNGESFWLSISLATIIAGVRFHLGVGVLVISQMIHSSKCFSTCLTGIRSFICVSPLMNEEIIAF